MAELKARAIIAGLGARTAPAVAWLSRHALGAVTPAHLAGGLLVAAIGRALGMAEGFAWTIVLAAAALLLLRAAMPRSTIEAELLHPGRRAKDATVAEPNRATSAVQLELDRTQGEEALLASVMRRQIETVIETTNDAAFAIGKRLRGIEQAITALIRQFEQVAARAGNFSVEQQYRSRDRKQAEADEIRIRLSKRVQTIRTDIGVVNAEALRLTEQVLKIGGLAENTKVLAVNIAIEASRGGAQQAGFTVIAREVRELAQRSAEISHEIEQGIAGLIGQIDKAVEKLIATTSDESTHALDDMGVMIDEMVTAFERIRGEQKELISAGRNKVAAEVLDALASIQFQDITRQQLGGVVRAIDLMDERLSTLCQTVAGNKVEAGQPFAERMAELERSYVSFSQRRDFALATGNNADQAAAPAIELF